MPIAAVLRDHLLEHKLTLGRSEGLFFGRTAETPFDDSSLASRAETDWRTANERRAENELEALADHAA